MAEHPALSRIGPSRRQILAAIAVPVALVMVYSIVWRLGRDRGLVVYCAHDSVYSEAVLRRFTETTGIPVSMKFDTEATKSLGLVELIRRERERPVCDVFWNNELLGTMDLAESGLLVPHRGTGYARIPPNLRDPEGRWVGFAGRLRVFIVNTDRHPVDPTRVAATLEGDLSAVAMAKPLFGTTLTHYTALWQQWGRERLIAWHVDVRKRGLNEVLGNATVKDLVADGHCSLGYTDTDDAFVALDAGKPVDMLPVRVGSGKVVCIPNTVAIVKGTRHLTEAQRLVDYLLSEETELALARSRSRQIPLGPVDESRLSEDVRRLRGWANSEDCLPLGELLVARRGCLSWLKSIYVDP